MKFIIILVNKPIEIEHSLNFLAQSSFWRSWFWHSGNISALLKQAMMTLQGMADHRFTSVSLFTNVFLGEIIFFP